MANTLKDWMLCALYAALLASVVGLGCAVGPHLAGWLDNADQFMSQQRQSAVSQARMMATIVVIADNVQTKVASLDTKSFNDSLASIRAITGNLRAIVEQERGNWPVIEEAMSLLWQHTDNTIGHLDKATLGEQAQQKAIADAALDELTSLRKTTDGLTTITGDVHSALTDPQTLALRAAATRFLTSYATLGGTLDTAAGHIDARFFAPYTGNHPKLHAVGSYATGILGLGSRGAEGTYYGIAAKQGLAK